MAAADRLAVQVRDAADLGAALRGLRAARRDIVALLGERSPGVDPEELDALVSPAVPAPEGPLLVVDGPDLPADEIVEVVAGRVRQAGERHGHVTTPATGGPLDALETVIDAVVLRLFPRPNGVHGDLPVDWLDVASDWALGDLHALDPVRVRVLGVEFEVSAPDAVQVLQDCLAAGAWCDVVQGDLDDRLRTVSLTFGALPHLALAGGGPGAGDDGLVSRFELLRDAARELAGSVTWSCLTIDRSFGTLATGLTDLALPGGGWQEQGGAPPNAVAAWLVDEHVPDVYAHQVLSPGHIEQLGVVPEGGEALGDGRVELTVGEPKDWLPGSAPTAAYEAARERLAPLLVSDRAFDNLVARRFDHDDPGAGSAGAGPAGATSDGVVEPEHLPALDAIVLEPTPHRHRSNRLTLLELVAWIDGQPHSDHPARVSPAIGTFARWLAVGLDDKRRQGLRDRAAGIVRSAGTPSAERLRAWRLTRWLVQVQTASWLRRAGMEDLAAALLRIDLDQARGQTRAIDVLGRAAVTANRRLAMTSELVYADRSDADRQAETDRLDDAAWEAWECANGPAGWVAAAEAAVADAPGEVAAAADQRVIDVVRHRAPDDPPIDSGALANEVWSVALGALADHLWTAGWRAADRVATRAANVDLAGPALGTAAEIWDSLGDDDRAAATAAAHEASRGPLARSGLGVADAPNVEGGAALDGEHPWDAAVTAAVMSPAAAAWRAGMEEVRSHLGEAVWAQAMAAARATVDAVIDAAPDLIARARLVALAREASGAAARVVAAEAVAVARTTGADDDDLVDAGVDALGPVADPLADGAVALLDRLLRDEPDPAADTTIGQPPRASADGHGRRVRRVRLTAGTRAASKPARAS